MLDFLKDQINRAQLPGNDAHGGHLPKQVLIDTVTTTSRFFTEALERDDTDLELWRRTSRICGLLGSRRVARFCLEAVLDGDGGGADDIMDNPGLEEAFASHELRELLVALSDEISQLQPPLSRLGKRGLPTSLKRHVELYPFLSSQPSILDSNGNLLNDLKIRPMRYDLVSPARTWAAVGKLILQQLVAEQQGINNSPAGVGIVLRLPGDQLPSHRHAPSTSFEGFTEHLDGGWVGAGDAPNGEISRTGFEGSELNVTSGVAKLGLPAEKSSNGATMNDEGRSPNTEPANPNDLGQEPAELAFGGHMNSNSGPNTVTLPTRKRSSDSAGHVEPADGGRIRSKRIRARESVVDAGINEEGSGVGLARHISDQLEAITRADHWMFEVIGSLLSKLGIGGLGSLDALRESIDAAGVEDNLSILGQKDVRKSQCTVIQDLRHILNNWTDDKGNMVLYNEDGEDLSGSIGGVKNPGLTIFLEHSKRGGPKGITRPLLSADDGLVDFQNNINNDWVYINEVALRWINHLLLPAVPSSGPDDTRIFSSDHEARGSTYTDYTWPDTLKETMVQILVGQDGYIFQVMEEESLSMEERIIHVQESSHAYLYSSADQAVFEMVQTIFELHLDIYASITNPSSEVDIGTRTLQKDRLTRWAELASRLLRLRPREDEESLAQDILTLRYLWAATFFANMSENVSREHVLLCLGDLKSLLEAAGNPVIDLQNNAVMPEVSAAAAEREISRLTTMDFFLSIFSTENGNPVAVIESLEPILDPTANVDSSERATQQSHNSKDAASVEFADIQSGNVPEIGSDSPGTPANDMSKFLERGSASLRLFLWRRLRYAYEAINYPPKVFSCCLRSIEIIMKNLKTASYLDSAQEHRESTLLKWIRYLDDLIIKALNLALNEPSSFECIDNDHARTSMSAIAEISRLLHSFTMYEDSIRVGEFQPSASSGIPSMAVFANKLREMQVRTWTLQYALLKDGMAHNRERFPTATDDLADYLRVVHYCLGIRSYCKLSNKVFLKFMKMELLVITTAETGESDLAQVMFDLHGLKLSLNIIDLQDHGCPIEPLDRRTAIQIMEFVMTQVNKVNIKDLAKTELKSVIEKMQQVIGAPKPSSALVLNRRIFNAFMKSPINPIDLYRSLKGIGDLSAVPITAESATVAKKGWYFLLGYMALIRFRSQKRVTPGPTDDLDLATYFFKQDLEYNTDKWETWYRLATVYDARIEEDVLWSAEKLNNHKADIIDLQRCSIHCYSMAIATSIRCADTSVDTTSKISDLYTDFGLRIYASSREPFSMEAFNLDDFSKHFSAQSQGMYKQQPFRGMELFPAWKFASVLFRHAMVDKPGRWMLVHSLRALTQT